jgi:hypothetical protein
MLPDSTHPSPELTRDLALTYRLLSPAVHRSILGVVLASFVSVAGIALAWSGMRLAWGECLATATGWVLALYPEAVLTGGAPLREPFLLFFAALFFLSLAMLKERQRRAAWGGLAIGARRCSCFRRQRQAVSWR